MSSVGANLIVSGHVQGVGYRYFVYQRAVRLGLNGWVRNEPGGTVRLRVEGDRSLIEELIDELKVGPPSSAVSDVAVSWCQLEGAFQKFDITR